MHAAGPGDLGRWEGKVSWATVAAGPTGEKEGRWSGLAGRERKGFSFYEF